MTTSCPSCVAKDAEIVELKKELNKDAVDMAWEYGHTATKTDVPYPELWKENE